MLDSNRGKTMQQELTFNFGSGTWLLGRETLVMGILNVTPDSFSDGGRYSETELAVARGLEMTQQGAAILDIGGESTRPGSEPVTAAAEQARVIPVISALAPQIQIPISIDTQKAAVAEAALAAGASIINDVSGLQRDPDMIEVLRNSNAGCILMHMRGTPETMQGLTQYDHLLEDICVYFRELLSKLDAVGVARQRIMLDPGIGFSKTLPQNLELIANIAFFRSLGRPLLAGPSRKSFLGKLLGIDAPSRRQWGTAGAVAACAMNGADVVRVHDVAEMAEVVTVVNAIRTAAAPKSDANM